MRTIRWHPVARVELGDAAEHYARQRAGLGEVFVRAVYHVIDIISQFPLAGRVVHPGYHRMVVHRFPYSVIYRVRVKYLEIIAVVPHLLDQNNWIGR